MVVEGRVIPEHGDILWPISIRRFQRAITRRKVTINVSVMCHSGAATGIVTGKHTYQYVSISVDVLVRVEELAVVRDANEQRATPPGGWYGDGGGNGELCCL
jgi:hypothetical protein